MKRFETSVVNVLGVLCLLIGTAGRPAAAEPAPAPPDLTHGGKRDKSHDWLLGPTGARGWVFFRHEDLTAEARQILVTAVDAGSPADGILRTNDVILGVNGKLFTDDARKSFARAITAAEERDGVLRLIRWREGKTENVQLKLAVLGAYSDTAPYDCPKSKKIFEQGCQFIAKKGLDKELTEDNAIANDLNALALLASGNKEYRPMLGGYARKVASSLHPDVGMGCWFYAYGNLFLTEYVLATGDHSIMPEVKRITMEAAKAQTMNGMWGHNPALPNGHSEGYGGMNQVGLPMTISLVLARQAGVKDPAIDQAINRSVRLLRWFVNKGAIPYGDHQPGGNVHDDNGKTSCAAVLFDLLGDREATSFFARMATAAYNEREHGHCGNLWNMLWALPGAARGGPLATGAYLEEQSWYYDLARNWRGGFVYQEIEFPAEENKNYTDWDLTGSYLLSYGLPLKSLYVMGKKPCAVPPLNLKEVKDVIAAGRDFYPVNGKDGYDQRKTDELLAGLSSWSPALRYRSAQALGRRQGDLVPALLKMLAGSDRDARYGACEALGCLGPRADAVGPQLRALLNDPDPWLESLACNAIARLSPAVRKAGVNDLLVLAVRKNPADPRGMANRAVAAALFDPNPDLGQPGILRHSLEGVDRRLLYPAMESLLQNDDGLARYGLVPYVRQLADRDLAALLPAILKAVEKMAPSDEMFGDGIRLAGLDLLSRLHIREGMPLCVSVIEMDRWNEGERLLPCLKCLLRYGVHAREVLPQLREAFRRTPDWMVKNYQKTFDKAIADIEASKDSPTLVSLKDFIAKASASGDASNNTKKGKP
jgi:hypothetical protein